MQEHEKWTTLVTLMILSVVSLHQTDQVSLHQTGLLQMKNTPVDGKTSSATTSNNPLTCHQTPRSSNASDVSPNAKRL